ncbi:MAG: hypothetical protein ACRDTE_11380, partial [Pseudonocardiaceae bacterium]
LRGQKLDEFAEHLVRKRKLPPPAGGVFPIDTALDAGRSREHRSDREAFFAQRLDNLLESADPGSEPAEVTQILGLGLDEYSAYLEILTAYKGDFHRRYLNQCLDSLLLNPDADGQLRPPLLVFVPPGTRASAEDSFGVATFEQIMLGRVYDELATRLLRELPPVLGQGIRDLFAVLDMERWSFADAR